MKFVSSQAAAEIAFRLSFMTATIMANYAREGTTALATYSPAYIQPGSIIWCHIPSCIIMGMLQELKIAQWFAKDDLKSLFTVLTTGFCGAYSSYSTFILETFQQATSLAPSDIKDSTKLPNRAYGIMEFLAVVLTQLFTSMGAYLFGRGLAKSVVVPLTEEKTKNGKEGGESVSGAGPQPWVIRTLRILQWGFVLLAIPLIALIIVLTCVYENYSRGVWTLHALFGIFGGFARYELSNWLNSIVKNFPTGTFVANEVATVLVAVFQLVLRGRKNYHEILPVAYSKNSCYVTRALTEGFCGSLSTLSTFINEGYNLPFVAMLIYFAASVSISFCLLVIILGSYAWTRGLTNSVC